MQLTAGQVWRVVNPYGLFATTARRVGAHSWAMDEVIIRSGTKLLIKSNIETGVPTCVSPTGQEFGVLDSNLRLHCELCP
jgi:hypothetical protein